MNKKSSDARFTLAKFWPFALSCCALLGLLAPHQAFAGGKTPIKPRPVFLPPYDYISAVDPTAKTISVGHKNSTNTDTKTYKITNFTEIQVNGNKATVADLAVGLKVSVTPGMDEDTADRIVAGPAPKDPVTPPGTPPAK